jgi:hypothetical protein
VPFQTIFESASVCLRFPTRDRAGDMPKSANSKMRCVRSSSKAFARRPSCLSRSSSALGAALENDVVYRGAFVPLPMSPPRPFETPTLRGARPPTVHVDPRLTCLSLLVEVESRRRGSAVGPGSFQHNPLREGLPLTSHMDTAGRLSKCS